MMKEIIVHSDIEDVSTRLDELGLTIEELQEAAKANFLAQASCTVNDAPTASGISGWIASVRVLREFLTSKDWKRENIKNSPRLIHPDNDFSIMFATGDHATGISFLTPRTKSNKGTTTRDSINDNSRQASLFDSGSLPQVVPIHKFVEDGTKNNNTWVFLVHVQIDESAENPKHIIRCELSLPVNMDDAGYINSWDERIIIPEIDTAPETTDKKTKFAPDQEIVLKRKK